MEQMTHRIIEIRKALQSRLSDVHPQVYYEQAPDTATYPYVVYNIADSTDDGSLEQIMLEVDVWDAPINNNTMPIETLAGNIDTALHRYVFHTEDVFFSVYRENRRNVEDSDSRLRRRQIEYQIRTMGVHN
jgi:L-ribulose-5-phosphate 3-epimerase UlaE